MINHSTKGTFGNCKRCSKYMKKKPVVRLYSLSFRKKQYWICENCLVEINKFIKGVRRW